MKSMPLLFMSLTAVGCAAPASQVRAPMIHQTPNHAAVVVRVAMPWYAPRFVVRRKFSQVLGEYEAIPTLAAKYFSISDDREFGGLYLWTSREAADQHFDAAWRANVRAKRGVDADVQTFDAPLVVDGPALPCGTPQGTRALAYPARATWTRWRAARPRSPRWPASSPRRSPTAPG